MFGDEPTNADALQAILDSLDACVWAVRPTGEVCYGNRRWWDYSGLSPSERDATACFAVIHPDERAELEARWHSAQERGQPGDMKCRLRRAIDGSYRWHLCRALPVRAASGKWTGWILVATDIDDLVAVTAEKPAPRDGDVNVRRIRAVLQDAPLPVGLYEGAEHRCVFSNRAADGVVGQRQAGKTLRELFPEADAAVHALFDEAYAQGAPAARQALSIWRTDDRGQRAEHFFDFVLQPTCDATGQVFGVVAACVDVTAAVRDRRALEQTADRLARLQSLATALADVLDPEIAGGVVVDQAVTALGASACELSLLDSSGRFVEGLAAAGTSRSPRTSLDSDQPAARAIRTARAVVADDAITLPLQAHGRTIGALGLTFAEPRAFDDGARSFLETLAHQCGQAIERARLYRLAERARQETEAQRARLRHLLLEAPVPLFVSRGRDHIVELVNPRWEVLLQHGKAPLGRPGREAFPSLAEQGVLDLMDAAFRNGETLTVTELPCRSPGGQTLDTFFNLTVQPTRGAHALVSGLMVIAVDVTDQVRAHRRLQEEMAAHETTARDRTQLLEATEASRAKAELASRSKDEFLALLGHELRNPLAPIVVALRLIRMRDEQRSERELTIIERQVGHLTRLVDDLLDVSRLARGLVQVHKEHVELAPIVGSAVEMASPLLERRHHHLTVDVAERGLVVDGDPVRLAQVIANLLTNAAKYTDPGGHIEVHAAREAGELVLRVKDDGIGLPAAALETVFDMFVQGKRALDRSEGGLGLGLTLVRSWVELHGGNVSASSGGPGQGSEFTVRLPLVAEPHLAAPIAPREAIPSATGDHRRVLLVDDNNDVAEVMGEVLSAANYDVAVAHDGAEALRLAERFHPDIAVLDIGLPVMDGYELARRLHDGADGNRLRLVAVTGYGQSQDRERSQAAGFEEHLVKPVDVDLLLAAVAGKPH